jgi:hypothetical protein
MDGAQKHDIVACISDYWRGLDSMIGFIALTHSTRNYKKYSTIADLHTWEECRLLGCGAV